MRGLVEFFWERRAEILARKQEYYVENLARLTRYKREYVASHPDAHAQLGRRYRARKSGAEGSHTTEEWRGLCADYFGRCAYCSAVIASEACVDHIVSLRRGGSDAIDNLVPSCRACNSSKCDRPLVVFLATTKRPLGTARLAVRT